MKFRPNPFKRCPASGLIHRRFHILGREVDVWHYRWVYEWCLPRVDEYGTLVFTFGYVELEIFPKGTVHSGL